MPRSDKEAGLFLALMQAIGGKHGKKVKVDAVEKLFNMLRSKSPKEFKEAYGVAKDVWLKSGTGKKAKAVATKIMDGVRGHIERTAEGKPPPPTAKVTVGKAAPKTVKIATKKEASIVAKAVGSSQVKSTIGTDVAVPVGPPQPQASAVAEAVATPAAPKAAFSGKADFTKVRREFIDAGIKPGKGLNKLMSNLKKNPDLLAKIGGKGGGAAVQTVAREAAPTMSLLGSKSGIGDLFGTAGLGTKGGADAGALAQLTKGVGSKVGRLAGKVLRTGIPFAAFEAITIAPRLLREAGFDPEFDEQIGAIESVSAGVSHEALSQKYMSDKLLAQRKARLLEADPMAMQFLMGAMSDGGLPQKLTQNEVMIGGSTGNTFDQSAAGDEIARAFMGF